MRYVLGPEFDFSLAPVDMPPPVKPDPAIEFVGVTEGVARFQVPAYDPETSSRLMEIFTFLVPSGATYEPDADWLMTSTHARSSVTVGGATDGLEASIPLPKVEPGAYFGRVVYGFDD